MKAIRIHEHGPADVLKIDNIPEPACQDNLVKVQIKATALNHLDIWVRNGLPGIKIPLPLIMGSDASGIVVEVGDNIDNFNVGDKVVIQPGTIKQNSDDFTNNNINYSSTYGILGETENGVQAEYVSLPEYNLSMMLDDLTFEESASMQLVFMTSYQMLVTRAQLQENEYILIYGATSGIGSSAIQIAKDLGAKIISTVGSEDKFDYALNMGSDYVLTHNEDIKDKINQITSGKGIDVVCEHIGHATWKQSLSVLNKGGRIVTCGATTGSKVSIDLAHLFMKQQTIIGSTMASLDSFNDVMKKIKDNRYRPFVDKVFSFNEVKQAHLRMENREHFGKIVLVP